MPMRQILLSLLVLICLSATAQQPAPLNTADASHQVSTNQDTSSVPLKTADGVAACPAELKFKSLPDGVYRVGGGVLPPKLLKTPEATFSDEGRKFAHQFMKDQHVKQFEAISLVRLTVDSNGMTQDICVMKEAGHGLDRKAVEAVAKYRFDPATRDGKPVPVRLAVEVNFKIY